MTMNEYSPNKHIQQPNSTNTPNDLVIGKGVLFIGTVVVPNRAIINGTFNGELTAKEVHVTETGVLTGVTTAANIRVQGEIHNEIHCRELLSIQGTGKATGRIYYGQIEIERGGKFSGSMKQRLID
jgi:cytoskeletal protein CcmA (bactofilin family)